jgi:hypothetical protein
MLNDVEFRDSNELEKVDRVKVTESIDPDLGRFVPGQFVPTIYAILASLNSPVQALGDEPVPDRQRLSWVRLVRSNGTIFLFQERIVQDRIVLPP